MKKWIVIIGLSGVMQCASNQAWAFSWKDLWQRPDQQGAQLLADGKADKAAEKFKDPNWRGVALYRAGRYKKSAEVMDTIKSSQSIYNRGNALAHMGKYHEAIKAYDKSLALNPHNEDAHYNRELLKKLLKKEKQQQGHEKQQQQQKQQQQSQSEQQREKDRQSSSGDEKKKQQQSPSGQQKQEHGKEQQKQQQAQEKQQDKNKSRDQEKQANQKKQREQRKQRQRKSQRNKPSHQMTEKELEQQHTKNQMLRRIPDDPGGLLRQKFLRDHLKRRNYY